MLKNPVFINSISHAIELEEKGYDSEAFSHYLKCIQELSGLLRDGTTKIGFLQDPLFCKEAKKSLTLLESSLDRLKFILSKKDIANSNQSLPLSSSNQKPSTEISAASCLLDGSPLIPRANINLEAINFKVPYRTNLLKITDKHKKADMTLSLYRKECESIEIAKANETKRLEKEQRYLNEAKRILGSDRKHHEYMLLSKALLYEQEEKWLPISYWEEAESRMKRTFRDANHPLNIWLRQFQRTTEEELGSLIFEHNKSCKDNIEHDEVHAKLKKSVNTKLKETSITLFHHCCALFQVKNLTLKDSSFFVIQDLVIEPLWPTIISFYKMLNRNKLNKLEKTLEKIQWVPMDYFTNDNAIAFTYFIANPHLQAILDELSRMLQINSLVFKCNLLVNISQRVCQTKNNKIEIGADILVQLLSFVLLKSSERCPVFLERSHSEVDFKKIQLPQLSVELDALEEVLHYQSLMGTEGYALTSFQAAFNFLELSSQKYGNL